MLIKINKWCAIFAAIHLLFMAQFKDFFFYCIQHPQFLYDLLILSLSAFVGQLFVYRMIKEFKQHMVPFVITTRKIFTVGLSIVYFHH
jgi:UDP-galactose transporter B1